MEDSLQETGKRKKMVQKTKRYFDVFDFILEKPRLAEEVTKQFKIADSTTYEILGNLSKWEKVEKRGLYYCKFGYVELLGDFKLAISESKKGVDRQDKWILTNANYEAICKKLDVNPFDENSKREFKNALSELGLTFDSRPPMQRMTDDEIERKYM